MKRILVVANETVAGKPLIDHVLGHLRAAGVKKIVVNVHYLADALSGGGACIDGTANRSHVATHDSRYESSVNLFPAHEANIRRFHHRVSGFNHRHQATTFNHSECFRH